jgi:predicted Zn finger-like uncharacterized protein
MNIACTVCSARYVVPDEKIAGRRVRITCKRCKALLTVDGSVSPPRITAGETASVAPGPASSSPPVSASAAPPRAAEPVERRFTVTLADEKQELADVAQIVRLFRAGRLTAEALVWREGMGGWESPWDVPEISDAFRRMGIARPAAKSAGQSSYGVSPAADEESTHVAGRLSASDEEPTHVVPSSPLAAAAPAARPPIMGGDFDEDEATRVVDSSPFTAQIAELRARDQAEQQRAPGRPAVSPSPTPSPFPAQTASGAVLGAERRSSSPPGSQRARREPKFDKRKVKRDTTRESQVDLFAKQAQAGSEAEALEQAIIEQTRSVEGDEGQRLTGARNESSVLFSLDALLQREERATKPKRSDRSDEALLVAPASSLPDHVVTSPLIAPDFTAPVLAPPPSSARPPAMALEMAEAAPKRSRLMLPLLMVGVLAAGAAAGYVTGALKPILGKQAPVAAPEPTTSEKTAAPGAQPTTTQAQPNDTSAAVASGDGAVPSAPSTAGLPAPPATGLGETAAAEAPSASAGPAPVGGGAPAGGAAKDSTPSKPASLQDLANAINSSAPPFNTAAAKEALTAAAGDATSCATPGGPTGSGKVAITFAPSGRATSVSVGGAFAGTEVGSCIARKFRGARVPAFSGEPVSVSKSVTIQ